MTTLKFNQKDRLGLNNHFWNFSNKGTDCNVMCLRETQWEHTVQRSTPDISKSCSCMLKAWIHNDGLCPGTGWASTDLIKAHRVDYMVCFRSSLPHKEEFENSLKAFRVLSKGGHWTPRPLLFLLCISALTICQLQFFLGWNLNTSLILWCISTLQQLLCSLHLNALCRTVELYKWAPSQASFQSVCRKMRLLF